ncbi:MAG: 30S ribosomal protein S13 [Patescibacteria group bacterium]|jgi:small subunit ribosomal protein S13|nr:30S ribosomal protein S13 [Patescibacteria group bacterium]
MAIRISGVTIPNHKKVEVALTYVYGIGPDKSKKILEKLKISPDLRVKDINEEDANKLRTEIEKSHKVEGDLRRDVASNVKRLKEINSYRGLRHTKKLSVRGQRTKTNSRTVRGGGKRVAVGGQKKATAQTT